MWEQAVKKTAATFAPRSSTKSKNPAVPGSTLYTVFEVQGYVSMVLGGLLSYNLIFPSSEPDLWRLMGMWSIWMFSMYLFITTSTFDTFWHNFYITCTYTYLDQLHKYVHALLHIQVHITHFRHLNTHT